MSYQESDPSPDVPRRERALSRWDNEGGAGPCGPQMSSLSGEDRIPMPEMAEAELGALHVRVIALENLVIALLASGSDQQLELARRMDPYISPRPGFTNHPLTTHAAAHITNLIERALRFRNGERSGHARLRQQHGSGHGYPPANPEG
jgi:hypothetical protein